jgi:subtilase family serine protease
MTLAPLTKRIALATLIALPFSLPASAGVLVSASRAHLTFAPRFISIPAAKSTVDFGVHLPLRNVKQLEQMVNVQSDPDSPMYRHWLTPAQFRQSFGPSPAQYTNVLSILRQQGFAITKVETQLIHVRGTVDSVQRAFNVHLGNVRTKDGRMVLASREQLAVPSPLAATGATVVSLGYQILPQPQSNFFPQNRYGSSGGYWFDDLKQAYDYPSYGSLNGAGMTIATVGYSDFNDQDAKLYFNHELLGAQSNDLAPRPVPKHVVFGDSLAFDPNSGTSDEADLDVQQSAGSAPGATVVGYAAPATDAEGFLYAYSYIVDNNNADVVSTSYGECELFYTPAYNGGESFEDILQSYHQMFLQGNSQGITFIFSSGDDAGQPCPELGYLANPGAGASYKDTTGTSIWSDDPNVTSVGGTNLETVPNPNPTASPLKVTSSAYRYEIASADRIIDPIDPFGTGNLITNAKFGSGGGRSVIFEAGSYQASANTGSQMRMSPDISMHMGGCPFYIDPVTGNPANESCNPGDSYDLAVIGGQLFGLIGTSASAPEFAGVIAVAGQEEGGVRFGNANVLLYKIAQKEATNNALHQGIPAWNGVVTVPAGTKGWNQVVGLGTPDVLKLLGIPTAPAAGNPQTPTNP